MGNESLGPQTSADNYRSCRKADDVMLTSKPAHRRGHGGTQRTKPARCSLFALRAFAVKAVLLLLTFAISAQTTHAEDYSNNIGFMKNPPKELKEKFPMCDQFLDVKWIKQFPEGNWVGMVTADVYLGNKKEQMELLITQKRTRSDLDLKQLIIINVSNSEHRGDALKRLILSADKAYSSFRDVGTVPLGFSVVKDRKWINVAMAEGGYTYARYSQNVCITLPKGEAGWIREYNKPFWGGRQMSDAEKAKFVQFKALAAMECSRPNNEIERGSSLKDICSISINGGPLIRNSFVLQDVDGDGMIDYRSGRFVAFLNDSQPFFLNMPRKCFHDHSYYEHQGKLKEERCVADEKRRFLHNLNRKNDK